MQEKMRCKKDNLPCRLRQFFDNLVYLTSGLFTISVTFGSLKNFPFSERFLIKKDSEPFQIHPNHTKHLFSTGRYMAANPYR